VFGGKGRWKKRKAKDKFFWNSILIRSPRPWYFDKGMSLTF
jgi:hypothetical protein